MSPSRRRAIGAVRGLASRSPSPRTPCAAWHPAPSRPVAARRCRPAITHAHYPFGAIGTSRPTAITPAPPPRASALFALSPRRAPLPPHHYPRALPERRDAWPPPPVELPTLPARAAAPPARFAPWQVAHAESFAGASPCAPHSRAGRGVRSPHPRRPAAAPPGSRHRIFTLKISMKTAPTDDGIRMADFR